jgi:hypothetical protein
MFLLPWLTAGIFTGERQIMNFTPKTNVRRVSNGILTVAVVGLIGWVGRQAFTPPPIVATQDAVATRESLQRSDTVPIFPAIEWAPGPGFQMARPDYYQPVFAWYKNKHWWKRNAPIVGGAAGGGLVGGLVGGGKGALIGGAVGGGGGYLYKRSRHHHHNHH